MFTEEFTFYIVVCTVSITVATQKTRSWNAKMRHFLNTHNVHAHEHE